MMAALALVGVSITVLISRLYIAGPANFYWQGLTQGWLATAVIAWTCYLVRGQPEHRAPGAAQLLCMVMAQMQVIGLVCGLLIAALLHAGLRGWTPGWGLLLLSVVPALWMIAALVGLLLRGEQRHFSRHRLAAWVVVAVVAGSYFSPSMQPWYPEPPEMPEGAADEFVLTQEVMEAQPEVLARRLQQVPAQRPGRVDMYALSFAPYAGEEVFRRESEMVLSVMRQRFDARGGLQLLNHHETTDEWPWATPLNLQRALKHLATVMDREEDILFLHLTSHGAGDGALAADFWPMSIEPVTPAALKAWLDEAGIRHRVISVSACFSGSWLDPLADEHTLVLTAADADHTSYGCGRLSELTFFGRAMYDEQLRLHTLSFEDAHAAAREVIRRREREAGKDDGYSNPQIRMGHAVRERLARLVRELAG